MTAVFGGEPYTRLARVFRASCRREMPAARFVALRGRAQADDGRPWDCRMNTEKLRLWVDAAERWAGDDLILADCDMMAVGDAAPVFQDQGFDIGYTERSSTLPINGGIVFVRPTRAARRWLRALQRVNSAMREDPSFHAPYREKYHGMNQAAMGFLLENPHSGVRLRSFPCSRYNAMSLEDWRAAGPDTVFVHVKSGLRKMVLGQPVTHLERVACERLARAWREIEESL